MGDGAFWGRESGGFISGLEERLRDEWLKGSFECTAACDALQKTRSRTSGTSSSIVSAIRYGLPYAYRNSEYELDIQLT